MYNERSGSLGAQSILLDSQQTASANMNGGSGDVPNEDGRADDNLEDLKKLASDLRQKTRAQAQQIMAWRRAYKMQELLISRLQREKSDQLRSLSSKLLLFESRLIRKQKDISTMLNIRENIIHRQQRIIETLTNRLIDNGLDVPQQAELSELDCAHLPDLDSLNDSDSAVVMEDIDSDGSNMFNMPKFRSANADGITVVRSISDAIDSNLKYTSSVRRNNGFLRRPEILETVYSVEEDGDSENQASQQHQDEMMSEANKRRDAFATRGKAAAGNIEANGAATGGGGSRESGCHLQKDRSLEEKVCQVPTWPYCGSSNGSADHGSRTDDELSAAGPVKSNNTNQVKTYNRVMSNHRSVTKPKDVKYKRINKAKSKSLEELRGRLKNWVEQGSKLTGIATLEHSQSYA